MFPNVKRILTILLTSASRTTLEIVVLALYYIQTYFRSSLSEDRFHALILKYFRNSHQRCSAKKRFLKISQISQENTCVGVLFHKNADWIPAALSKVFSSELCQFLRTPILKNKTNQTRLLPLFNQRHHTFIIMILWTCTQGNIQEEYCCKIFHQNGLYITHVNYYVVFIDDNYVQQLFLKKSLSDK